VGCREGVYDEDSGLGLSKYSVSGEPAFGSAIAIAVDSIQKRSIGKISWANLVAVTTTDVRGDENAFSSKRSALTRYYLPCGAPSLSARLKAFYLVMGQYDGVVIPSSEAA